MRNYRIGISMREDNGVNYHESRDCLAQDWWDFLNCYFPDVAWIALPNIGNQIENYVDSWGLNGFLFTGGNDVGSSIKRDETESKLLEMAVEQSIPVFGVCRGLQKVNAYFGGSLILDLTDHCGSSQAHVGKNHIVEIQNKYLRKMLQTDELYVNSYHRQAVTKSTLASNLEAFAVSKEGLVEGVFHVKLPIMAIQWHPERKSPSKNADLSLINAWLDKKEF